MDMSELDALQSSLNHALDAFREELTKAKLPQLSTFSIEPHPLDAPEFLPSPRLYEARRLALACVGQLKTLLQSPYEKVVEQTLAPYDAACLDIVLRTGVIDKLSEDAYRSTGLHVQQLHQFLDLDPFKLTAILRYLAAEGWLHEKSEGIYALNRPTLELCLGRNGRKWALTQGKGKIADSLLDAITHPGWKYSTSPLETAFQLSHHTPLSLFDYLKANPAELQQWANSVRTYGDAAESALMADFPWKSLNSQTIVDCGGGQGYLTISLARILEDVTFVIQDLPEVIPITKANVSRESPAAAQDGRIIVEAHDFRTPQVRRSGNTTYVFRLVLHDWTDQDCTAILKNIPAIYGATKVIIIEYVAQPCAISSMAQDQCDESLRMLTDTEKYAATLPPPYVPLNFGVCAKMNLGLGVHLLGVYNARERSLLEWDNIIRNAGMQIAAVYPLRTKLSVIECDVVASD
ncbi:S-adenosyl-L-methionine-dependent methyltransferase [Desarmillaria tabescens]|uniref:S-adenosyl-L-methionine-dependent methyltransferase n=1 Tax=Armillaria tabescens TaxID=1929756 RepID=A0AA39NNW1_ARMTA|nr:S-adenosyl-L-methionine-dependent methyltransferase [Desarmillaria tabescens]KAK0469010.1 S-adenosyl-L-methionine-dependent methyltransferase [Desarmillaria tabescens]